MHTTFPAVRMTIHIRGSRILESQALGGRDCAHISSGWPTPSSSTASKASVPLLCTQVHTGQVMSVSDELPIANIDVSEEDRGLSAAAGLIDHAMITLDEVTAFSYAPPADGHPRR